MEQEIKIDAKEIMTRLAKLQKDIDFVKEHIGDITLTEDDLKSLEATEESHAAGKTISHDELKKELGF